MDIAEVAKRSGVPASALRYYERRGLIRSLTDTGTRRRFAPAVLDQLALIALGQAAGFSLDEIRLMFTPDGKADIDRDLLAAKADELERLVRRLKSMIEGLRHAAVCPAPSHSECPSFQKLLRAAVSGALDRHERSPAKRPEALRPAGRSVSAQRKPR